MSEVFENETAVVENRNLENRNLEGRDAESAESRKAAGLNRRAFLQTAGLAVAGAAATGTFLQGERAEAQTYPAGPKLVENPLKPAIFETDGISRRTHEEHFKLYQGYVKKFNEITEKLASVTRDPAKANQTFSEIRELKVELSFALGGVKNHELYFDILTGGKGSKPDGALLAEINKSFGSPEAWAADLKATGIAARGWVWTAYDHDLKQLVNYIGDSQNTFPIWNATPILGLDVYEHAYYLDFATKRGDYIDAFLRNINWNAVATRFGLAKGPASTLVTLG